MKKYDVIKRMTQTCSEKKNSKCFKWETNLRSSDEYFKCSTAEPQETHDRLGCLTSRSMITTSLHISRRGVLSLLSLFSLSYLIHCINSLPFLCNSLIYISLFWIFFPLSVPRVRNRPKGVIYFIQFKCYFYHRTKLQESVNGNVAETCNSMFPLCLRKSGPVPLYTQQRKREKTSRNR